MLSPSSTRKSPGRGHSTSLSRLGTLDPLQNVWCGLSVVHPNTLNLDPDQEFWPNLAISIRIQGYHVSFEN